MVQRDNVVEFAFTDFAGQLGFLLKKHKMEIKSRSDASDYVKLSAYSPNGDHVFLEVSPTLNKWDGSFDYTHAVAPYNVSSKTSSNERVISHVLSPVIEFFNGSLETYQAEYGHMPRIFTRARFGFSGKKEWDDIVTLLPALDRTFSLVEKLNGTRRRHG